MALRLGAWPRVTPMERVPWIGALAWRPPPAGLSSGATAQIALAGLAAQALAGVLPRVVAGASDVMLALEPWAQQRAHLSATAVDTLLAWAWPATLLALTQPGMEAAVRHLAAGLLRAPQPPQAHWRATCGEALELIRAGQQAELALAQSSPRRPAGQLSPARPTPRPIRVIDSAVVLVWIVFYGGWVAMTLAFPNLLR